MSGLRIFSNLLKFLESYFFFYKIRVSSFVSFIEFINYGSDIEENFYIGERFLFKVRFSIMENVLYINL